MSNYTINFKNDDAVLIPNPYITFIQATQLGKNGKLELLGPVLNATGGTGTSTTSLENGKSYSLSSIQNTLKMGPQDWNGHMYVSDGPLTLNEVNKLPVDPNYTLSSDTTRYQLLEFAGSTTQTNIDITYINWFSMPLEISTSSTNTRGKPKAHTYPGELFSPLESLSADNAITVIKNNGNLVRIVSANAGGKWMDVYPSFEKYIKSVFSGSNTINLSNQYDGIQNPPSDDFKPQSYQSSSVSYDGTTLEIKGTTSELGKFSMTSKLSYGDLSNAIYLSVLNYAWSYDGTNGSGSNKNGNTGDNNVFSAISRDLLAGFAFGFIGSSAYGTKPSSEWQSATTSNVYSGIQPNEPYYNQWANIINGCFNDVYTFPFNDYLSGYAPELPVSSGDTVTVTILGTGVPA